LWLAVTIGVALSLGCSALAQADDLRDQLRAGEISRAEYALQRARALFSLGDVRSRYGSVRAPAPAEATPILQELSLRMSKLRGRDRRQAAVILARPTDGNADPDGNGYRPQATVRHSCFPRESASGQKRRLCVHWAVTTIDAPPDRDDDDNGRSDQVDRSIQTLRRVWATEIGEFGYRAPRPDRGPQAGQGPNPGLDIYLVDVGDEGFYGYCTTDPREGGSQRLRAHAYCVLDDDFAPRQFDPGVVGLPALRITSAHELFHAIQFAYEDSQRDKWLKEGTAAWIEDEVFNGVNSNYDYLPDSPLHQPEIPLDFRSDDQSYEYGAWIFWRFLSEYFGPRIIKRVWEVTAPTANRDPSAQEALNAVIVNREPRQLECYLYCDPVSFRQAFSEFVLWNSVYNDAYEVGKLYYREGPGYYEALLQRVSPPDATHRLDSLPAHRTTGRQRLPVAHLSSRRVEFITDTTDPALPPDATLRISVYLPERVRGPEASVAAYVPDVPDDSFAGVAPIHVRPDGDGSIALPATTYPRVSLTLANAGTGRTPEPYWYQADLIIP
jgi:hypothetical protein